MRTLFLFLLLSLGTFLALPAQSLKGLNFQGAARGSDGSLLANQPVNLEFTILADSDAGPVVYQEDHAPTTNDYALFSVVVGKGSATQGSFDAIDWGSDDFWLRVKLNGAEVANTQLEAVPYSKVATQMDLNHLQDVSASSPASGQVLSFDGSNWVAASDQVNDADADPNNEIQTLSLSGSTVSLSNGGGSFNLPSQSPWQTSGSTVYYNGGQVGIGTSSPTDGLSLFSAGNDNDLSITNSFPFIDLNTNGSGNAGIDFRDNGVNTGWFYHDYNNDAIVLSGVSSSLALPNLVVAANGRIGIGTYTPAYPLHLTEDTMSINGLEIANLGSANLGLDGDVVPYGGSSLSYDLGNNTATEHWDDVVATAFVTYSDARLKEGISSLTDGLEHVLSLRPVQYTYKRDFDPDGRLRYGLIAQEVQAVLPNIVVEEDVDVDPESGEVIRTPSEYKTMVYSDLIPVLIQAIQEQQAQIEALKQRVEELENQ
ncbi:MAG: tail fiber domain-containing protein [Bacteroidetes bacterium]|nr:MAG: tail fiber domain-containing protein [Bacteroidota bacterium]